MKVTWTKLTTVFAFANVILCLAQYDWSSFAGWFVAFLGYLQLSCAED